MLNSWPKCIRNKSETSRRWWRITKTCTISSWKKSIKILRLNSREQRCVLKITSVVGYDSRKSLTGLIHKCLFFWKERNERKSWRFWSKSVVHDFSKVLNKLRPKIAKLPPWKMNMQPLCTRKSSNSRNWLKNET